MAGTGGGQIFSRARFRGISLFLQILAQTTGRDFNAY
jgi:hypothetical protein